MAADTPPPTTQPLDPIAAELEQKLKLAEAQTPSSVIAAQAAQTSEAAAGAPLPGSIPMPELPTVPTPDAPVPSPISPAAPGTTEPLESKTPAPAPADAPFLSTAIPWSGGLSAALVKASATNSKVAAFLYSPESAVSRQINQTVFADPAFAAKYSTVIWAADDVSTKPDLMRTHKILKVPVLIIFGADGKELKRFEGVFTQESFHLAYSQLP